MVLWSIYIYIVKLLCKFRQHCEIFHVFLKPMLLTWNLFIYLKCNHSFQNYSRIMCNSCGKNQHSAIATGSPQPLNEIQQCRWGMEGIWNNCTSTWNDLLTLKSMRDCVGCKGEVLTLFLTALRKMWLEPSIPM